MKTTISLLLLLVSAFVYSQQTVSFDLNSGKFDKKLSYVDHIVIVGDPIKGTTKIDIIELVITTKDKSIEKSIAKKETALGQATVRIATLETLISDSSIATEYTKDYEAKLKELKQEQTSDAPDAAKIKALQDEIKSLKGASKTLHENQKGLEEVKRTAILKEISELKQNALKNVDFARAVWKNNGDERKFKLELKELLRMTESYDFQFNLYTHKELEFPIDKVSESIVMGIANQIEENHFLAAANIDPLVEKYLDSIANTYFGSKAKYDAANQTFSSINADSIKQKDQIKAAFVAMASPYQNWKNYTETKEKNTTVLLNKIAALANGVNLINDAVANAKLKDLFDNRNSALQPQFDALIDQFGIDSTQAAGVWNALEAISNEQLTPQITSERINVDTELTQLKALIDPQVKQLYLKSFEIKHSTVATIEDTKLDATRIGTHYGVGAIFLENSSNSVVELSQFVAINIRFGAYDNRLPGSDAFKTCWSRFSFVFGMSTTGNLEYKGQPLTNTRIGIKPMFGLSFQPVKHMDISLTTIAFNQESISLEQSYTVTKFRPMLSVAFDFNAVNYLINQNK